MRLCLVRMLHQEIVCGWEKMAVFGVLCLLVACFYLGLEVTLAVRSFDEELDLEMVERKV